MLNPPPNLWNLVSRVKIFTQLEDGVKQAKKATRTIVRGDDLFKKHKESSVDYESWVR